jgi:hypothetical protein
MGATMNNDNAEERDDAEHEVFEPSEPMAKDWFLRRRLLRLGVPAAAIGLGLAHAGRFLPNPFVNGV